MLVSAFQDQLHSQYQGDTETPDSGDDDYQVRLTLLYDAINAWETADKHIFWLELWTMLSDAADGDKTTDGTTLKFDAPTDFKFPGGFVRLIRGSQSAYYKVYRPESIDGLRSSGGNICWFTGNKRSGFFLNFLTAPTTGQTIEYPYYKSANMPTTGSDIIEMSDPHFCIKHALAKLHELDGEGDRATLALSLASAKLEGMKANNETPVWFQDNSVPDRQALDQGGFGQ